MDFPYQIPLPVALAIIAVLGYMVGPPFRVHAISEADKARRELRRAKVVARELEQIAEGVRKHLATHHLSVAKFKDRVSKLSREEKEAAWQDLCSEAEQILKPTLRLAEQIALAYDEIRQQTNQLMTFSEVRTDPLTRVSNRRCLDETLDSMFAMMERYASRSRWRSSTSTTSSRSTTRRGTCTATARCRPWPGCSTRRCATPTSWPATAARSSSS